MNLAQQQILIFGAGKSATVLIDYLIDRSVEHNRIVTVVDADPELVKTKTRSRPNSRALSFNIHNNNEREQAIADATIVISMLPPTLHFLVAQDCIALKKDLLTASYVDNNIKQLEDVIKNNGLLFLCEMGLDPGIDHMSAKQLIDEIIAEGGKIKSFKSHCGGLIAPESDNNPWHYKISWNPANVVNAGKAGAIYKKGGRRIQLDYTDVFSNCETVIIPQAGVYAFYPNRDSLSYSELYGLQDAETFMRTTLRHPDFCIGWQYLIEAGLTDNTDNDSIKKFKNKPVSDWFTACLNFYRMAASFNDYIQNNIAPQHQELIKKLCNYLGLNNNYNIPDHINSSADILQFLLETRLKLEPHDKDLIIMLHEIEYCDQSNNNKTVASALIVKGTDRWHTGMAKTVGLPLAIAAELILAKKIKVKGLHIPIMREIYEPVLSELSQNNINFTKYKY